MSSFKLHRAARRMMGRPQLLAFVPVLTLGAYWAGGEIALLVVAVVLPIALAALGGMREQPLALAERDSLTGLILRDGLIEWADAAMLDSQDDKQVAVISMVIDDIDEVEARFGRSMRDTILKEAADRLTSFLRDYDVLARVGHGFALGLQNVKPPETDTLLELGQRLQSVFEEPFSEGPTRTYCSLSLGLAAESHVKSRSGTNVVVGAQRAGELAAFAGPGSVRVYNDGLSSERAFDRDVARDLSNALENGEIIAWFQPQIATDTKTVLGFEALARWDHPERGMISPAIFLPDIEKCGLSQRLAEVILKQSLMAINAWDAAGFAVNTVSVNFSSEELRNPRLPEYIRWELDRYDLAPSRLIVEVLESVASDSSEDVVTRTLNTLSGIGCGIDLDDFGTGFTSFINIRRFDVGRIKIDRSLVSHVDHDAAQRKMFKALLAFSAELGIEALAEGVETDAEFGALEDLGCKQAQGFLMSRPMPLGDTLLWLEEKGQYAANRNDTAAKSA